MVHADLDVSIGTLKGAVQKIADLEEHFVLPGKMSTSLRAMSKSNLS